MKNIYIIIIVLIILVGGGVLLFGMNKQAEVPTSVIQTETSTVPLPTTTTTEPEPVLCTMDAKLCPDGSYVGRSGPKCEFAACPKATTQAVKEFVVKGQNFSFTPSLITVKKGDRVKIVFENTSGFHDFKIDAYGVATKQTNAPTTEVLEFTADKIGSFEYYCSVGTHRAMGMKGTLKVE